MERALQSIDLYVDTEINRVIIMTLLLPSAQQLLAAEDDSLELLLSLLSEEWADRAVSRIVYGEKWRRMMIGSLFGSSGRKTLSYPNPTGMVTLYHWEELAETPEALAALGYRIRIETDDRSLFGDQQQRYIITWGALHEGEEALTKEKLLQVVLCYQKDLSTRLATAAKYDLGPSHLLYSGLEEEPVPKKQ